MGTLNNRGSYDCLAKLEKNPDMPFFLLLASDKSAPETIRHWASHAMHNGVKPDKIAEAYRCADEMEAYRRERDAKMPE